MRKFLLLQIRFLILFFTGINSRAIKVAFTLLLLLNVFNLAAQTTYVPVPPTAGANSALSRGPNGSVNFQRTAIIYPASEVALYPISIPVKSIGFSILTPANVAATGNIKIYMANTTNLTYSKSTTWTAVLSSPTAMQLVYDGPMTIPATAGFYDVTLATPFQLVSGSGFYLAYEWTTTTRSTASATYNCNNTLTAGSRTATSATGPPATLSTSSDWRPILRLGYTPPANDIKVVSVFSLGKVALQAGTPQVVQAMVANIGNAAVPNVAVSMAVSGANTVSQTFTIPNLPAGDTVMVTFPGFTSSALGVNNILVSVPADDISANNSASVSQIVTTNNISYALGNPPASTSAVGYTGVASGTFLSRFHTNSPVAIPNVKLFIASNNNLVGKTIYAVVTDSMGTIIGRSADHVIAGGDLDALVSFAITTPSVPAFNNTDFYVGMAIPANAVGAVDQFPLGNQPEQYTYFPSRTATRPKAYYTGTLVGGAKPTQTTRLGRFIIEAEVQALLSTGQELAEKAVSIYPNPNNGRFTVSLPETNTGTTALVYNTTGQLIFKTMLKEKENTLELKHLKAGMYNLQLLAEGKSITKRLVIQ